MGSDTVRFELRKIDIFLNGYLHGIWYLEDAPAFEKLEYHLAERFEQEMNELRAK